MAVLEVTILLILLVIVSNILSHYLVSIPTALIEIAVGVIAALVLNLQIELDTDWFMLLFVAPLLYADAKHFPKKELWELRAPIFGNAILLVFLTTLAGGVLINLFIPDVSLPLSFALAAVLSPTDPVAVQGIAEQVKLPKRILTLVSGESLINDASGLIAFKYALAAFLTGEFSFKVAATDFIYMSILGMIIGYVLAKIFYWVQAILLRQGIQDVVLHSLIQLLKPFVIFLAAEAIHASGVIAVVVAGVISIQEMPLYRGQFSEIKLVTTKLWDIVIYLLNGIVFVVLGALLPLAMHSAIINPAINNGKLILYVVIIWMILMVIRTLWTYSYMWFSYFKTRNMMTVKPKLYTAILSGLTGVRGAVTMAMVLSIPFFLPNGDIFRERYLIIFLASGVILMSLLVAVITLPILTKQKRRLVLTGDDVFHDSQDDIEEDDDSDINEIEARKLMTKQAIQALKLDLSESNEMVVNDLLNDFDRHLRYLYLSDDDTSNDYYHELELSYRKIAVDAETQSAKDIINNNDFSKLLTNNYLKMLNYKKKAHVTNISFILKQSLFKTRKKFRRFFFKFIQKNGNYSESSVEAITLLEIESAMAAVTALENIQQELDTSDKHYQLKKSILSQVALEYQSKINRLQHSEARQRDSYDVLYQEYFLRALDEERSTIQLLLEQGKISSNMANQLRQSVNYNETTFLQGSTD